MDDKLKRHIQCLIENVGLNATRHKDQERAMKEAKEVMEVIVKNCSIPVVSNCTTFSNRKFIRPVFDGISTVVTQYQVVDELGQFWFQGTKEDCDQFLYSC